MRRIVNTIDPSGGELRLDADAAHYVTHVLRLRDGERVEVVCRSGACVQGTLRWRSGVALVEDLDAVARSAGAVRCVAAGLLKAKRWEWLVEKCAELGATDLVPVQTARSVVDVPKAKLASRLERWQRIADEAVRQSERSGLMRIHTPCPLGDVPLATSVRLWCAERASDGEWPAWDPVDDLTVFVGPEGGWSADEASWLSANAVAISLGPSILRAETAAAVALAGVRLRDGGLI